MITTVSIVGKRTVWRTISSVSVPWTNGFLVRIMARRRGGWWRRFRS